MNESGASQFNQARIEWAIRLRYSPMPELDMKHLAAQLNAFRIGDLRMVGKTWEIMMERDGELAVNADKRQADLSGLQWNVVSDGSPDGDKHAAALTYLYKRCRVTKALEQDSVGGVPELLYQIATAHSYFYSAHEMLLRIDNAAQKEVTYEFRHTPIWFLESRRGYLGYLPHIFDLYGQPCAQGEWLTAVGLGWMRPLCIAYGMKHFPLRDWLQWCARYGGGYLEGITNATKDSPEWNEAMAAMQNIMNDGMTLHTEGVKLQFLEQSARNQQPFEPLVERVDRLYAKCYRGMDMATSSRSSASPGRGDQPGAQKATGASVQKEESGIFLVRDAMWATGYLNERVDAPVIRYLFGQEPRAGIAIMPPLEDTSADDLAAIQALVPLGLKIALSECYKKFKFKIPAVGEACLEAAAPPPELGLDGKPLAPEAAAKAPKALPSGPSSADEAEPATQPAVVADGAAIGAGARPGAIQTADNRMPDPQVDASGFWSRAGLQRMPALAYALPNAADVLDKLRGQAGPQIAGALTEDLQHALQRFAAILQVKDATAFKAKMQSWLADYPNILADATLDPATARGLANLIGQSLLAGLKEKPKALANDGPADEARDANGRWTKGDEKLKTFPGEQFGKGTKSNYLDFEKSGEWFHARIADHANTTEQTAVKQMDDTFREQNSKLTTSGLTHPHNLNIVVDTLPKTKGEMRSIASNVSSAIPKPGREDFHDGTIYGQTIEVRIPKNGQASFENLDSGEKGELK